MNSIFFLFRRAAAPTRPANPIPKRATVVGSGTGFLPISRTSLSTRAGAKAATSRVKLLVPPWTLF